MDRSPSTIEREAERNHRWAEIGAQLAATTLTHPFVYARTLMQLGYEPIAPQPGTALGQPILMLPNVFQYIGYIMQRDGFTGCWRGLPPRLLGQLSSALFSAKLMLSLHLLSANELERQPSAISNEDLDNEFRRSLKRDFLLTTASLLITTPFEVCAVRRMAQMVGNETQYDNLWGSWWEIYQYDGLSGFYAGFVPRLCYEAAVLVSTRYTLLLLSKYFIKDPFNRRLSALLARMTFESIFYPLRLVAACMAVTGTRLLAGGPPLMPVYSSALGCWYDLAETGQLHRGSSFFLRTAEPRQKSSTSWR